MTRRVLRSDYLKTPLSRVGATVPPRSTDAQRAWTEVKSQSFIVMGDSGERTYTFAEVPDCAGEALSLSGLVLNVTPAAPGAPRNAFVDLMPIVPTARRVFRRTDQIAGFARVYRKKWTSATVVTVRITDERSAIVTTWSAPLDGPPNRTAHGADYDFDVPVAGLARGEYLLSVDVEAGDRTVRRAVRFTVE